MRRTSDSILKEIRELFKRGEDLNYAAADENHAALMRAAALHFGNWRRAVEMAGLDYQAVSKYIHWTPELVIERIRELHRAGVDLSWHRISSAQGDPALAAAAVRPNVGFDTWHEAVTAAGLDYEKVARYRHWTPERVVAEIQALAALEAPLSSKMVQQNHAPLYNAAKRRFRQWDTALRAAGLNPDKVRMRRATEDLLKNRRRRNENGQMTMEHLLRPAKPTRRSPKKSHHPVPPKPLQELPPPPKLPARPLQRRDKKTGEIKMAPVKKEVFKVLTQLQEQRAKVLKKAAKKPGLQPLKGGYRAELHGAEAKAKKAKEAKEKELKKVKEIKAKKEKKSKKQAP